MATTKLAQVLQLTPANEIVFEGPFEHVVTSYLELKNPTDQRVCFKVKTTAPRRYCVRPNSGIVEPGTKVRIAIMLQPIELESQSERSKHKFMVQSTFIKDDTCNLDTVWQKATPEETMDSKLRCVFSTPNTSAAAASAVSATENPKRTEEPLDSKLRSVLSAPNTPSTAATGVSAVEKTPNTPAAAVAGVLAAEKTPNTQATAAAVASAAAAAAGVLAAEKTTPNTRNKRTDAFDGDKSVASSHNLTASSFLQPMSDDKKFVLVSLVMLLLGVILGKYII